MVAAFSLLTMRKAKKSGSVAAQNQRWNEASRAYAEKKAIVETLGGMRVTKYTHNTISIALTCADDSECILCVTFREGTTQIITATVCLSFQASTILSRASHLSRVSLASLSRLSLSLSRLSLSLSLA